MGRLCRDQPLPGLPCLQKPQELKDLKQPLGKVSVFAELELPALAIPGRCWLPSPTVIAPRPATVVMGLGGPLLLLLGTENSNKQWHGPLLATTSPQVFSARQVSASSLHTRHPRELPIEDKRPWEQPTGCLHVCPCSTPSTAERSQLSFALF